MLLDRPVGEHEGFLEGDGHRFAVDVEPVVATGPAVEGHRQDLTRDPVAVRGQSGVDARPARDPDAHAVGHGQSALLAQVVETPHELAGDAFEAKVLVEIEVEGDGPRSLVGDGEVLVLVGAHLDVVGAEPLAGDLHVAVLGQGPSDGRPVGLRERLLHLVDPTSEAGAESAEVGDDRPRQQAGEALDVLELLHVELVCDLATHRLGELDARVQQQRPPQRLQDPHAPDSAQHPSRRQQSRIVRRARDDSRCRRADLAITSSPLQDRRELRLFPIQ